MLSSRKDCLKSFSVALVSCSVQQLTFEILSEMLTLDKHFNFLITKFLFSTRLLSLKQLLKVNKIHQSAVDK